MEWRTRFTRTVNREAAHVVGVLARQALTWLIVAVLNVDAIGASALRWAQRHSVVKVKSFRPATLRLTKGGKLVIVKR